MTMTEPEEWWDEDYQPPEEEEVELGDLPDWSVCPEPEETDEEEATEE